METCGRYSGLMLSVLDSGRGVWVQDLTGHCAVFLCKTLSSHSASPHPGVFSGKPDKMMGGGGASDGLTSHPGGSSDTLSHFMLWKLEVV